MARKSPAAVRAELLARPRTHATGEPSTPDAPDPPRGHSAVVNVSLPPGGGPYACPCCGYLTLDARGQFQICPVCFWEDDGQDDHDAAVVRGGPNHDLSLARARTNFAAFGASSRRRLDHVRPPHDEEHPLRPASPA
jgi:hypothetical protein